MEYIDSFDTDFRALYKKLTPIENKHYFYELIKVF